MGRESVLVETSRGMVFPTLDLTVDATSPVAGGTDTV